MPRIKPGPPCAVCGKPSTARDLCETHYSRWKRQGHTEQTRPLDWGMRNYHPLWDAWKNTKRNLHGRVAEWDDFWNFVRDVAKRPTADSRLCRRDIKQPWGPDNAYWKEPVANVGKDRKFLSEYQKAWRKQNLNKARGYDLKRNFGITLQDYENMIEAQNGGCAICGKKTCVSGSLAVDHCHKTKKIRGLLCSACNRALGGFQDDPELLRRAIAYLK